MKKITLEKFNEIKKELLEIDKKIENCKPRYGGDFYDLVTAHKEAQRELLSYDLSDIPFDAWEGITIYGGTWNKLMSFEKTKANIDFEKVSFHNLGSSNYQLFCDFTSCNVKNIESFKGYCSNFFDEKTINENKNLFLPEDFDTDFKDSFYENELSIEQIDDLTEEQFKALHEIKGLESHFEYIGYDYPLFDILGFEKSLEFYRYHKDDLKDINDVLFNIVYDGDERIKTIQEKINTCELKDIKDIVYKHARERVFSDQRPDITKFGKDFREKNPDIYEILNNEKLPYCIRYDYKRRKLQLADVVKYFEYLKDTPLDHFIHFNDSSLFLYKILKSCGPNHVNEIIEKHKPFFDRLISKGDLEDYSNIFFDAIVLDKEGKIDIEKSLTKNTIEYYLWKVQNIKQPLPRYLDSFDIKIKNKITTKQELIDLDYNVLLHDKKQRKLINTLGLEFIKKIDNETGLFSKNPSNNDEPLFFNLLSDYVDKMVKYSRINTYASLDIFMSKEDRKIKDLAGAIDDMEEQGYFDKLNDPRYYEKLLSKKYPNLFICRTLPKDFKSDYYNGTLSFEKLQGKEIYISHFVELNILDSINDYISILNVSDNFVNLFREHYGDKKVLELICKYGEFLSHIYINLKEINFNDEESIHKYIRNLIYEKAFSGIYYDYSYLAKIPEMVKEYPNIFIDTSSLKMNKNEHKLLVKNFYAGDLTYDNVRVYPELVNALLNTDIDIAFQNYDQEHEYIDRGIKRYLSCNSNDLSIHIGVENFLNLCKKYGYLMNDIYFDIHQYYLENIRDNVHPYVRFEKWISSIPKDDLLKLVDKVIYGKIKYGQKMIPDFLEKDYPEFVFNYKGNEYYLSGCFSRGIPLQELYRNKEWLKQLKGKSVMTLILLHEKRYGIHYEELLEFFKTFGEEDGVKLAVNKYDSIGKLIMDGHSKLMWDWYCKSGEKFIPDLSIMKTIPLEEADKFFNNKANWKELTKTIEIGNTVINKQILAKLAVIFGAFEGDSKGVKKLKDLIYTVPTKAKDNEFSNFLDNSSYLEKTVTEGNSIFSITNIPKIKDLLNEIKDSAIKEGIKIDKNKPLLKQLYKKNDDDSYSLIFNQNGHQELSIKLRKLLCLMLGEDEIYSTPPLCYTPINMFFAKKLEAKYDPYFRDFLINNMYKIIHCNDDEDEDEDDIDNYIEKIQQAFTSIRAYNSNRKLTYQAALDYVKSFKYPNVDVGNERLSNISSIAGYEEKDFTVLQDIYNLGKQRIYSTIPRIKNTVTINGNTYHYELLRLDDPLILAIGTLTDCCQEIHNHAQVTMEHSMVENNSRIFLIKDEEGNFVAQSWVWRNKDVLCFDNVEIPEKAYTRYRNKNKDKEREDFHNEIYDVYEKASKDILKEDNKKYTELLNKKEITKNEYDTLKLRLVTIGDGNSDLSTLYDRSEDEAHDSLDVPEYETQFFEDSSYDTLFTDSDYQYTVIRKKGQPNQKYTKEAIPVYTDTYDEYTDETLDTTSLLTLKGLEYNDDRYYNSISKVELGKEGKYVTELAHIYGTDPSKTKVVMNPNFGIIYEDNNDTITIVDIVYNLKVKEKEKTISIEKVVLEQIKLALEQIAKNKKIVLDDLDEDSEKLYKKAESL